MHCFNFQYKGNFDILKYINQFLSSYTESKNLR